MGVWLIGILLSLPNIIVIKYESIQSASGSWEQSCGEDWTYYDKQPINESFFSLKSDGLTSGDYMFSNDTGFDSYLDKMFDILDDELTASKFQAWIHIIL